jgi:hypothetical protein
MWGLGGGWPTNPPEPLIPAWATFAIPTEHRPTNSSHNCVAIAAGWPLSALSGGVHVEQRQLPLTFDEAPLRQPSARLQTYSAFILNPSLAKQTNGLPDTFFLPYRIAPLGFFLDTLLFGGMWFLAGLLKRRLLHRTTKAT